MTEVDAAGSQSGQASGSSGETPKARDADPLANAPIGAYLKYMLVGGLILTGATVAVMVAAGYSLDDILKIILLPLIGGGGIGGLLKGAIVREHKLQVKLKERDHELQSTLTEIEKRHQATLEQQRTAHQQRLEHLQESHSKQLEQQGKEFEGALTLQTKQFESALRIQGKEFSNALTIEKKGPVVEQVLAKLHEHAFRPLYLPLPEPEQEIQQISNLLHRVLVYFKKEEIIDRITEGLELCFGKDQRRVLSVIRDVSDLFHRELHRGSGAGDDEGSDAQVPAPVDMNLYLARVHRALLGASPQCRLYPIELQTIAKGTTSASDLDLRWIDVRFATWVRRTSLNLASGPSNYTDLTELKTGDLIVFWSQQRGDKYDGIAGIAGVREVSDDWVHLGRRETTELRNPIPFTELSDDAMGLDIQRLLTANKPLEPTDVDYALLFTLFKAMERIKMRTQVHAVAPRIRIPARLDSHYSSYRLMIDFNLYHRVPMAEAWLHRFFRWHSEGRDIRFSFRGAEHSVRGFKARTAPDKGDKFADISPDGGLVEAGGEAPQEELDRSHTEILLTAGEGRIKPAVEVTFALSSDDMRSPVFVVEEVSAKSVKCPNCSKVLQVPQSSTAAKFRCPDCKGVIENPFVGTVGQVQSSEQA